jgi:hypothetical protein
VLDATHGSIAIYRESTRKNLWNELHTQRSKEKTLNARLAKRQSRVLESLDNSYSGSGPFNIDTDGEDPQSRDRLSRKLI